MSLDIYDILGKIVTYFVIGMIGAMLVIGLAEFFSIMIYANHLAMENFRVAAIFGFICGIIVGFINDSEKR